MIWSRGDGPAVRVKARLAAASLPQRYEMRPWTSSGVVSTGSYLPNAITLAPSSEHALSGLPGLSGFGGVWASASITTQAAAIAARAAAPNRACIAALRDAG